MGSGDPAADALLSAPVLLRGHHPGALPLTLSRRIAMARDATAAAVPTLRPAWLLDLLPLAVVLLIAAHVLALARHGRVQAARAEQEALTRGPECLQPVLAI
ncbi:unnamed protein product [Urochloa decumbens]|uniref:Uncharacterized protein n=1 Tax=Urochloa decumbens TaxID=240449 RepID=A0ABC8X2L1_9POAL